MAMNADFPLVSGAMAGGPVLARLVEFIRILRRNGFRAGIGEAVDAARVAELCGVTSERRLRQGLRCLLCDRATDWKRFDELFDAYWHGAGAKTTIVLAGQGARSKPGRWQRSGAMPGAAREAVETAVAPDEPQPRTGLGQASSRESLAGRDFRQLQDPEQAQALQALAERLAKRLGRWRWRRWNCSKGQMISFRHTLRNSLRSGGIPFELAYRRRVPRPPRLLLLLDVSGSMSLYSLLFLRFARSVVEALGKTRAFVFHTRLVPVTDALKESDPRRAAERLELLSAGWSGGTRIGEALEDLLRHHGAQALAGRPVLIILSDGLDTGAPERLGDALARLKRRVRRVVWLNPLLGRPGYQPSAGGMKAALPYLDVFAPAHNLASLLALEQVFASQRGR